jgi:hypothetical protein
MKAAFHYFFLVTMPILGILGLLHLGRNLKPPAFIGGEWRLEITPAAINDADCATLPDPAVQPSLEILQSGRYLILELNIGEAMSLRGRLDELTINSTQPGTAVFQATVDRQNEPDRLSGALTLPTCQKMLAFTGIRQSHSMKDGGGH